MNETASDHTPTAEFRAMLEREVVRAFQRESRFAHRPERSTWDGSARP